MKNPLHTVSFFAVCAMPFFFVGCQTPTSSEVMKTSYYHPYGPEIKPEQWKEQGESGEVVELLNTGIEVRKCYANGLLQGVSSWSFPHSKIIERFEEYDNGKKVAFGWNFPSGSPEWQDELLSEDKRVVRAWYEDGSPRFVEEFIGTTLHEGQYFTDEGDVEAIIVGGNGMKVERTPRGALLARERYSDKAPVLKETFYPNGLLKEVISYRNGKKDGIRKCFDDAGRPEVVESWKNNVLDGVTTYFQNGSKVRVIHYVNGKKEGIETIFQPDTGSIVEEISWQGDAKHGPSCLYSGKDVLRTWYFKGARVSQEQYKSYINEETTAENDMSTMDEKAALLDENEATLKNQTYTPEGTASIEDEKQILLDSPGEFQKVFPQTNAKN